MTGDSTVRRDRSVGQGLRRSLRVFRTDEAGSTAIEYGLIASIIALMLVSFLTSFSDKLSGFFLALAGAIRIT